MDLIYLDNAATTSISTEAYRDMIDAYGKLYGNSSSLYSRGREADFALEEARAAARQYIENTYAYDLSTPLDDIRPDYSFEVSCQKSVPQALRCFLEAEDYEDAIRNAVSLGGDADTQAAIAGSVASAYYSVPKKLCKLCISKSNCGIGRKIH